MKGKNLICLLENNVGGEGVDRGAPLAEAFPTRNLLWNLVKGIYFFSTLKFRIPGQGGFKHIFDCYRFRFSKYFFIILLLTKKKFKEKEPNYSTFIITNLCLSN